MTPSIPLPPGPFDVIYADPPWSYDWSIGEVKSVDAHYPVMSLEAICALPVGSIAAPRCALFLWVPGPKIRDAFPVIDAWGFEYKSQVVWDKAHQGGGYWVRARHELLLIATRGDVPVPRPQGVRPPSVLTYPRSSVHSQKPPEIRELIRRMTRRWARSYIELFARGRPPSGWVFWGNDAAGSPGAGGRPWAFVYSRDQARRLRAAGKSWRGILRELRLPDRALSSIRWACRGVQKPVTQRGAETPGTGFCTPPGALQGGEL